jgi:hypothetical protein
MEINGKHIMFKAENLRITPYEIAKETASNVWYKKEKFLIDRNAPKEFFNELQAKRGRYHYWAETFDEAKQWLIDGILKEIEMANKAIEREIKYLESVKGLIEPKITVIS